MDTKNYQGGAPEGEECRKNINRKVGETIKRRTRAIIGLMLETVLREM